MTRKTRSITITIVIGLLLSITLFIFLTQLEKEMLRDYETREVVRSVEEVPAGTWITESNVNLYFVLEEVNGKIVTDETITNLSMLCGSYANRNLSVGEIMYLPLFSSKEKLTGRYNSPTEISIRIEDEANGVAGTLRKGDCVNIFVSTLNGETKQEVYKEILKNIVINEAYDSVGNLIGMSDKEKKACIITFYVEESEVAMLLTQLTSGTLIIGKVEQ